MKTSHKGIGKKIVIAVVSIFSLAATAQEDKTWRFGGQWGFHGNQSHYNGGMEQANARFEQQPFGGVSLSLLARYDYNKRWMFTSGLGIATFGFNFSISENYSLRQGRSLLPITNEFGVIEIPTMAYYKFTPNCRGSKLVIGAGIVQTLIGEQSSTKTYLNAEGNTNANYLKSECFFKVKDWPSAMTGYDYVNAKGYSKYFESATLSAARIQYFEQKNYVNAKKYFASLQAGAVNQDNQLEALRGLVRCNYQLKDYAGANEAAKELLTRKGISTDDKSVAFLVLGKSQQANNECNGAIASFKSCAAINKSAWGAEARYEIAHCQFITGNYAAAEKAALSTIKETGSYDFWVTSSYILIGDIFMQQKDYFNAKATFQSVAQNSTIVTLKNEAQQKLDQAIAEEKISSKVN